MLETTCVETVEGETLEAMLKQLVWRPWMERHGTQCLKQFVCGDREWRDIRANAWNNLCGDRGWRDTRVNALNNLCRDRGRKSARVKTWNHLCGNRGCRGGSSRWKGEMQIIDRRRDPWGWPPGGCPGGRAPGMSSEGASAPCLEKFSISELNLHDLVHTFCHHYIENLLTYFQ